MPPRLVCSQGTSELSFFLRSSFYWLLATRIEWEELCFIMSLFTLPSVKPWSLSNILKKINKDPGCIWKRLHSFESNRKFIQLLLNTLDEMLSYRFLLVSACIQLKLFTTFWYIPKSKHYQWATLKIWSSYCVLWYENRALNFSSLQEGKQINSQYLTVKFCKGVTFL